MSSYPVIEIYQQPIELCKLLKVANLVSGGGEAKIVISEGYVYLNGELETQKRKKIYHGDVVEFNGDQIIVAFKANPQSNSSAPDAKESKTKKNNQAKATTKTVKPPSEQPAIPTKNMRKPISF